MSRPCPGKDLGHKFVLFGMAVLLLATGAMASDSDSGYPGAFLRHGGSARSEALGEAGLLLGGGSSGMFYNPANLMRTGSAVDVSFMHFSNPLVDGYSSFALSLSRMYKGESKALNYLFGPNSAWGMMFLDLGVDGIIQRTADNELLDGELSYFDQALMMGFAHETVGSQGVLHYGLNLKFVGQGFDGASEYAQSTWGFGVDAGLSYQPVNPMLIKKIVPLKFLLPLRLGLNVQNLITPEMGVLDSPTVGDGAREEKLPTMVRTGFSYNLYNLLGENSRMLLVGDLDWMLARGENNGSRGMGTYLGCEGQITAGPVALEPRLGFNHVGGESKLAAGFGVKYPLKNLMLQFDFSQGFNEYLDDERRIAFSIGLMGDRGAAYFKGQENPSVGRARSFQILTRHSPADQVAAARVLAARQDTVNGVRYYRFIGGPGLARIEYRNMRRKFQQPGEFSAGRKKAAAVVAAYADVYAGSPNDLEPRDRIAYGEALLIVSPEINAETSSRLNEVLQANGPDLETYNDERLYLLGVKNELEGNAAQAGTFYEKAAAGTFQEPRSINLLANYGLAQTLLESGKPGRAIAVLNDLKATADKAGGTLLLRNDFPRAHPEREIDENEPYSDRDLADNVLFALGRCYERLEGQQEQARFMFASLVRFYPNSKLAEQARVIISQ